MRYVSPTIPPVLLDRLQGLRSTLEHTGTVILRREKKRRDSYRLRIRAHVEDLGYRKMLAIKLQDEAEALAVRELIGSWKADYLTKKLAVKVTAKFKQRQRCLEQLERRDERLALKLIVPKSSRRRVLREYDQVLKSGQIPATLYLLGKEHLRGAEPGKKAPRTVLLDTQAKPLPVQKIVQERFQNRKWIAEQAREPAANRGSLILN